MSVAVIVMVLFACYTVVLFKLAYENGKLKELARQQEEEIKYLKIGRDIAMKDRD